MDQPEFPHCPNLPRSRQLLFSNQLLAVVSLLQRLLRQPQIAPLPPTGLAIRCRSFTIEYLVFGPPTGALASFLQNRSFAQIRFLAQSGHLRKVAPQKTPFLRPAPPIGWLRCAKQPFSANLVSQKPPFLRLPTVPSSPYPPPKRPSSPVPAAGHCQNNANPKYGLPFVTQHVV